MFNVIYLSFSNSAFSIARWVQLSTAVSLNKILLLFLFQIKFIFLLTILILEIYYKKINHGPLQPLQIRHHRRKSHLRIKPLRRLVFIFINLRPSKHRRKRLRRLLDLNLQTNDSQQLQNFQTGLHFIRHSSQKL